MQNDETNATSRGSPRGRYGVSTWRCATQPHADRPSNVRAQPTIAPGNSAAARTMPAPQPAAGTTSESRNTTSSPAAASHPALRAPPASRPPPVSTTRAPPGPGERAGRVGGAVVDDDHLARAPASCAASAASTSARVRSAFRAGMTTLYDGATRPRTLADQQAATVLPLFTGLTAARADRDTVSLGKRPLHDRASC